MHFRLSTLLIVLALGPPMIYVVVWLGEPFYWVALVWLGFLPG